MSIMDSNLLLTKLRDSVSEIIATESKVAVAYSGGLDSSIIAALADEKASAMCYTCAVDGSFDARNAKHFADEEGRLLNLIRLKPDDIGSFARSASRILKTPDPIRIAYTIPILCVLHRCSEGVILTGSGADELFCGYAKYAQVRDPRQAMAADLEKMLSEAESLSSEAASLGKYIGFPYAMPKIISAAAEIPIEKKINSTDRKIILREIAATLGIPSHARPKKAAQYSSGVMREMERQAKEAGLSLSDWTVKTSTGRE